MKRTTCRFRFRCRLVWPIRVSDRGFLLRHSWGILLRHLRKARNIAERLAPGQQSTVRRALGQAWRMNDADKAAHLMRNLAKRFENMDQILTVVTLALPFSTPAYISSAARRINSVSD